MNETTQTSKTDEQSEVSLSSKLCGLWHGIFGNKKSKFGIEYYPITKKYFPKYNGMYMNTFWVTGIIREESFMVVADSFKTEAAALEHIEKFKEQQLKENVKTIPVE